ncbi:MAG: D-alanine--D-alanine ligase [Deltaproteobacteria bacterium]|nr:D-alanine--D-alanine ligase [Deltaproteobacteria bacterium]
MTGRVGVLMGGPSSEREVSLESGRNVLGALQQRGHDAVSLDWVGLSDIPDLLRRANVDVVWNALHGTYGEDGCVQGLCEILRVPYTGAGVMASALAMDKIASKGLFQAAGLRGPRWTVAPDEDAARAFGLPCVVKPSREGSSVGVSIVRDAAALAAAFATAARGRGVVLCEEYVKGREVSVGILEDRPIGTVEILPTSDFYDYEAKYLRDDTEYVCPAPLADHVAAHLLEAGATAHRTLGCRCYSRVDFLVDDAGGCFLLEVNTLPGMTSHSLIPKLAAQVGIDYPELCERILAGAGLNV